MSTGKWRTLPPMLHARRDAAAGFFGGRLYVTGGCNDRGGHSSTRCEALAAVDVWDPAAGAWSAGPSFGTARHGHGLGICPSGLLAFGGSSQPGIMNNPEPERTSEMLLLSVSPTAGPQAAAARAGWAYVGNLTTPRYGLMKGYGLNVGGEIFAVGGSTRDPGQLNPSKVVEKLSCGVLVEA